MIRMTDFLKNQDVCGFSKQRELCLIHWNEQCIQNRMKHMREKFPMRKYNSKNAEMQFLENT